MASRLFDWVATVEKGASRPHSLLLLSDFALTLSSFCRSRQTRTGTTLRTPSSSTTTSSCPPSAPATPRSASSRSARTSTRRPTAGDPLRTAGASGGGSASAPAQAALARARDRHARSPAASVSSSRALAASAPLARPDRETLAAPASTARLSAVHLRCRRATHAHLQRTDSAQPTYHHSRPRASRTPHTTQRPASTALLISNALSLAPCLASPSRRRRLLAPVGRAGQSNRRAASRAFALARCARRVKCGTGRLPGFFSPEAEGEEDPGATEEASREGC